MEGIDVEKKLLLQHIILSHHQTPEWGSPKRPMIKEAELLHHLDMIDSRMFDVDKAVTRQAPKKFYRNGSLSVWSLEGPFEVEQASEKWGVALFHIRTPKKIVIVDGGTFPPPEGVDLNVLIVDSEPTGEPDPKMVCISREGF